MTNVKLSLQALELQGGKSAGRIAKLGGLLLEVVDAIVTVQNEWKEIQRLADAIIAAEYRYDDRAGRLENARRRYQACCLLHCEEPGAVSGPVKAVATNDVQIVRPIDPNDKIGPAGVGPNRVVAAGDFLEYMVRFENLTTATAPVQEVVVADYLDAGLDWTTVEFEEIAYGDRLLTPPAHVQSFTLRDVPPADSPSVTPPGITNIAVNIGGQLNPQAGRVEWRLTCVDTDTGLFPADALTGILPPENGTGRGQGHVRFRVKPKTTASIGTAITNIATIVFDGNDPIATPPVWNLIGDVPSLAATIAYLPGQVMVGTPFTYTINLSNTGSSVVTNVVVANALPAGVVLEGLSPRVGTVTVGDGFLVWMVGDLAAGADATMTVSVTPSQAGAYDNGIRFSGGSGLAIFNTPAPITVLPVTPRPQLAIRESTGEIELSWPADSTGYVLQTTAAIGEGAEWRVVSPPPVVLRDRNVVLSAILEQAAFFRLAKP